MDRLLFAQCYQFQDQLITGNLSYISLVDHLLMFLFEDLLMGQLLESLIRSLQVSLLILSKRTHRFHLRVRRKKKSEGNKLKE